MATARPKCISSRQTAWLAVLLLAPWMILTITGGVHNHLLGAPAAAIAAGSAAVGVGGPEGASRLQHDDVSSRSAPCAACLWQLHSSASLPTVLPAAAALPAAPRIPACRALRSAADVRSFDPRGPPLS